MTSAEPVERPGRPRAGSLPASGPASCRNLRPDRGRLCDCRGGSNLPTLPLAVAVFVTVLVYWLAEEYAGLVEHTSAGHLPSWARTRAGLKAKWPIVSASYIPVATLLLARLLGATPSTAALIALVVIAVLLIVYGWRAGRAAGLRGLPLVVMTLLAGGLGLLMIFLKFVLVNLH